ncbi:MAG: bifunctional diaminohydroxyphosphoribosylaminopyrimidine deaminase/5-amino-6-(5-phosphoribosylamino)uracil reductase RibD [Fuerstiella sp.]
MPQDLIFPDDDSVMRHALNVACRGIGAVEPNPAVGAVIVDAQRRWVADGWHQNFGGPHAEVNAISAAAGRTSGAQLFVTLEPCSHHGKTPPCADAVIAAGFRRVVIGCQDPAPHVAGQGIQKLRAAGLDIQVGCCQDEAQDLIAPFRCLMLNGRPWVHAKWAMTLDGRIASRTGHSRWITGKAARAEVHRLRGRMDAIITAAGTVRADDPRLTVRPPGPRTPLRVVIDADGSSIREDGNLLRTIDEAPLLLCVTQQAMESKRVQQLRQKGVEVFGVSADNGRPDVSELLRELGRRRLTNVLVEAGAGLMGTLFDADLIDEVHVFMAPKILGGAAAVPPVGGTGLDNVPPLASVKNLSVRSFEGDLLVEGRVCRDQPGGVTGNV